MGRIIVNFDHQTVCTAGDGTTGKVAPHSTDTGRMARVNNDRRCVFLFKTQTALKSKVLRVAVSKVQFRALTKGNFGISGDHDIFKRLSHSSIVAERPRFNSTGIPVRPTSFKSSKFCIFLAPSLRHGNILFRRFHGVGAGYLTNSCQSGFFCGSLHIF